MKKLNVNEMTALEGGNYCQTLATILVNNCLTGGALAGAQYGWSSGSCGLMSTFSNLASIGCS
jgi:hypothetical protein